MLPAGWRHGVTSLERNIGCQEIPGSYRYIFTFNGGLERELLQIDMNRKDSKGERSRYIMAVIAFTTISNALNVKSQENPCGPNVHVIPHKQYVTNVGF